MDNLSRDVFGNVSFTKQLKENKSFSAAKMKVYHSYNCVDYISCFLFCKYYPFENFKNIDFKISLN